MTAAYLVTVNLDDPNEAQELAEEIEDAIEQAGIDVVSAVPYTPQPISSPVTFPPVL